MALWIVRNVKAVSRLKFLVRTCPACLLWLIKIDILNAFITLEWRIVLERLSIPFWVFAQCTYTKSHREKRSSVLNTLEMKKKKKSKFTVFSFTWSQLRLRRTLSVTGWCVCTPMNTEPSLGESAGWTTRLLLSSSGESSLPALVLGNSPSLHHKAPCGLISQQQGRLTRARLCAAVTYTPGGWRQPVWRSGVFSLGCITAVLMQGWRLYWCVVPVRLGGSSELWQGSSRSLALVMVH